MTRIYLKVVLGVKKEDAGFPLTPEMEAYWDMITVEVAKMRAEGKQFEIPTEIPEVEPVPNSPARTIRAKILAAELEGRA